MLSHHQYWRFRPPRKFAQEIASDVPAQPIMCSAVLCKALSVCTGVRSVRFLRYCAVFMPNPYCTVLPSMFHSVSCVLSIGHWTFQNYHLRDAFQNLLDYAKLLLLVMFSYLDFAWLKTSKFCLPYIVRNRSGQRTK